MHRQRCGRTEDVAAAALGVSATPVREAMLDLVREGMVQPIANRGLRIVPLSDDDLDDITELRVMLEVPPLVALASRADVLDEPTVSRLRALAHDVDAFVGTRDIAYFIDADRTFHLALIELHGNRRLVSQVERLRNATLRYGLLTIPHGVPDDFHTVSQFPALWEELSRRGYSDEDIEGIAGGNFRRVFGSARGAATAT